MKTTLVLCAKNEEQTIGTVIRNARPFAQTILVIDGHSNDRTREKAGMEQVRVVSDTGRGKGDAVQQGIREANHPIIVFMDADGSHNPQDIPALIAPIRRGTADAVIASRLTGGSDDMDGSVESHIRAIGSHIITILINIRFGTKLTESQNGFRAIRADVARTLKLHERFFTVEQDMIISLLKQGYRVTEIPSHEYARTHGKSHIRILTMGWRYVWHIFTRLLCP